MATFPAYADVLLDGFSEQHESALIRTEMESGPPRQAKVRSRVLVTWPAVILVESKADYQSFMTWFKNDIAYGADWFDFANPVTGSTVQARFNGSGLTAQPIGKMDGPWRINTTIETWSA